MTRRGLLTAILALALWAGAVNQAVAVGSIGITGANNATYPNSQYDLAADLIGLRLALNPSAVSVVPLEPASVLTNDILTAGPAANGRDQSGAFSASSWVHFYWIWNGTTLATVSSASATGPTMPTGYTHWAYAAAVRLDENGHLVKTRHAGAWAYYAETQGIGSGTLGDPVSGVVTTSVTAYVPPNALAFEVAWYGSLAYTNNNCGAFREFRFAVGPSSTALVLRDTAATAVGGSRGGFGSSAILPASQNVAYMFESNTATCGGSVVAGAIHLMGYKLPNGGE